MTSAFKPDGAVGHQFTGSSPIGVYFIDTVPVTDLLESKIKDQWVEPHSKREDHSISRERLASISMRTEPLVEV